MCHTVSPDYLVSCNYTIYSLQTQSNVERHWIRSFVVRKCCQYICVNLFIGVVAQSSRLLYFILFVLHRNVSMIRYSLSCLVGRFIYIYMYIRLKIKPSSVRILFLSCQIVFLPSTAFEVTPLIHCRTNLLALCLVPWTTRPHPLHKNGAASIVEVLPCLARKI
jgi:hypothetical protein